jgi:hypothetical protein
MADNIQLPGTGQVVATKSDALGNEFQEVLNVDKSLTPINPSTSDAQNEQIRDLTTTEKDGGNQDDNGITVADLLLKAMDKGEKMPLQVQLPVDLKQDALGCLIMSDMIGPFIWNSSTVTQPFILDCTGYDSVFIHKITTGVVTPYCSNDNKTFSPTLAIAVSTGIPAATLLTAAGMYIIPVTGKYLQLVGPASAIQCFIYLSGNPTSVNAQMLSAALQNITQYGSQPVVTANVNGMPAVGGNIAPGAAPTAYPVLTAGVDQLTTPLTRRFLTDALGRVQIGNIPSQNNKAVNILGFDPTYRNPLEVRDTTQTEDSQSTADLLSQILKELKAQSFILIELSRTLQSGGQIITSEADEIRKEESLYIN